MQLRQITGYLYLAFAALFAFGQAQAIFFAIMGVRTGSYFAGSIAVNFIVAVAAAVAGWLLLKRRTRPWLWLAVFVAGQGLFKSTLWELFLVGRIVRLGLPPFHYGASLWVLPSDFAMHFMLPTMFFLSIVLLFQSDTVVSAATTPAAAAPTATHAVLPPGFTALSATVARPRSLFGVLSLAFFGIGIPIVCVMASLSLTGGDDWDAAATLQLVSLLLFLCGFISVIVAFVRWEKRLIFPLLGYTAGVAPILFFSLMAPRYSLAISGTAIFGVLFCAACVIASVKTGERGRNWSVLAAIPSGFAVMTLVAPVLNFLAVWLSGR